MRPMAQPEGRSATCLGRLAKAARGVPKLQATIAFVAGSGRQPGNPLAVAPPQACARHAHLMPSDSLARVASTRAVREAVPRRALAARLRPPLCAPGGVLETLRPLEQPPLQPKAQTLAEVCQRASAKVAGRNGSLSLRHHQLRGLAHPRQRACLTAVHHVLRTRPAGTTAAKRFCGQQPRSMVAAILAAVELPPAPLRPPRRAVG
jgi:hypothetical protein